MRPRPDPVQTIHIVQPGETLSEIATQYGVSLDALMAVNDIVDPHLIKIGRNSSFPARHRQRIEGAGRGGPVQHPRGYVSEALEAESPEYVEHSLNTLTCVLKTTKYDTTGA